MNMRASARAVKKGQAAVYQELVDDIKAGRKWLLDIEETAYLLGLAPRTLYNAVAPKGENPLNFPKPKRVGRKLLWDIRDLQEYRDSLA